MDPDDIAPTYINPWAVVPEALGPYCPEVVVSKSLDPKPLPGFIVGPNAVFPPPFSRPITVS